MGWTDECQKTRYLKHSMPQWTAWIDGLPEEGFGRYTKQGWKDWFNTMQEMYKNYDSDDDSDDDDSQMVALRQECGLKKRRREDPWEEAEADDSS